MNIIFISPRYFPSVGGVEKHVEAISQRLIEKHHKVTVLTMKHKPQLADIETRGGVKILRLPCSNSKFYIWKSILKYKNLIKNADLVHIHDVFFWYLPIKLLLPLKPVFITFHGWEGDYPIPKKNLILRKVYERLAKGNICIGDYLAKYYFTKANYISYGGVNPINSQPLNTKNLNEIIFIGRLEKDLGLDIALPALSAIKKQFKLPVYFIGDGPYKVKVQKVGQALGVHQDLSKFLKKPAFIFSSSYLTILEAMMYKRPVFTFYQNPLKKDYLNQFPANRFIKIAGSCDELVSQFKNTLKNPKKNDRTVNKAYYFAKQQTWEKVTDIYLNLWNKQKLA